MARIVRPWTPDEVQQAISLREQGLSYLQIGRVLGRADNSVHHRLAKESGALNSLGLTCLDCERPIPDRNKSGRCRKCCTAHMNHDPEFTKRRVAGLLASPAMQPGSETRKRMGRKSCEKRMANPFYVAKLRHLVRTRVQPLSTTPEARARRDDAAAGRKLTERRLGWCPPEYRDDYRTMLRKGFKANEARQLILEQVRADRAKRASLSPFERQERALANGAQLVANDQRPSLASPGVYGDAA